MHRPPPSHLLPRPPVAWLLLLLALPAVSRAQTPDSTAAPTATHDSTATPGVADTAGATPAASPAASPVVSPTANPPASLPANLDGLGLENITVDPAGPAVAYENRRYRQSAQARGLAAQRFRPSPGVPVTFFERRNGMIAAAVVDTGGGVPAAVLYPRGGNWPAPPPGPMLEPTRRSVDFELVPLFAYEIGHIFEPVLVRFELEPRMRYNPWPGARLTAGVIIPVKNDFEVDEFHPDIDRVRPGPTTLEQFAWLKHSVLVSGTAGIFAANRYGLSVGAGIPFAGGAFLADAQADLTGYIAFPETGGEYSTPTLWTGFAGLTYRPPLLDLAVRLRGERYLYGDDGAELELRRSMGDLDLAFFFQQTSGFSVHGIRLDIPIPPMTRPTGHAVRVLPAERFPLTYRDEAAPVGRAVGGVASREDFLRQLSLPSLSANADRYRGDPGRPRFGYGGLGNDRVSLTGMTGFINTPWCGVMSDRKVELGYNQVPKAAAYDHRDEFRNDVYYAALGFLPHVEVGLRWTVLPGLHAFEDQVPDSKLVESDRMLSGRIDVFEPRLGRPGLAFGIEDAFGTRRYHSTYAVAGIPFEYQGLHSRLALGYAPRVLTAARYTLDGTFGAVEADFLRFVDVSLEYDTEKWNALLGVEPGLGLRARVAMLDMKHLSFGAGWSVRL
jgi:hypothetical protein